MNSAKIVITGASGFLGRHLVERLKDDGRFSVWALSSRPEQLRAQVDGHNIEYLHKDTILEARCREWMTGATVVNCAYPRASTGTAIADGLRYIQGVFESAIIYGARAVVNISSQSVYSPQRTEAATEQSPVSLESPYAVGKYAVELMLESLCRHSGTVWTNIRMASLIGPGFDQRIVNRFVKQALETGKLTVKRSDQRFGFFDVEDAADALIAMLVHEQTEWKPVYNLGGRNAYTLQEIAETVKAVLSGRADVEITYTEDDCGFCSGLDAASFYAGFGFEPKRSLEESVRRIAEACVG